MRRVLIICCVILLCGCKSSLSVAEKDTSSLGEAAGQRVVIYKNITFIQDTRDIAIEKASGEILIGKIPATIIPDTVYVDLEEGDDLAIISQEFNNKIISKDLLLREYLGRQVSIIDFNKYQDRKEIIEAQLLSAKNGGIYNIKDEVYLGYPGYVILPSLPEGYVSQPQLKWNYKSKSLGERKMKMSYLSGGLSWMAAYVMKIDGRSETADIVCWANISNNSGVTFEEADVSLVSGELNVPKQLKAAPVMRYSMADAEANVMPREEVFEYHLYTIPHKVTLGDISTKQVMLLKANNINIEKKYVAETVRNYYQRHDEVYRNVPVKVVIKTKNSKGLGLGEPLPSGKVRLYERREDGAEFFAGEDRIKDIPIDEEVKLTAGSAFDIICKTRQVDFKQLSKSLREVTWEIKVSNHKNKDVSVDVIETIRGNWDMINKDHDYEKISANKIKFTVKLKPDEEKSITYTVRVGI